MTAACRIVAATSRQDVAAAAALIRDYAASLPVDLAYQDFEAEMAGLPGAYAPPSGALLLARRARGEALGCVALRPLSPGLCEVKRLYVAPPARGLGMGRALADAVLSEARLLGYSGVRLDTLPSMRGALALYRSLGFREIAPYYATPVAGTIFLGLDF